MQVTLDIPDTLAAQLTAAGQDPARAALEALAVEAYRSHQLSESEVRRLLNLETRMEVHTLLADHDVPLHYTEDHLRRDIEASDKLHAQRSQTSAHAA
ncbi:MAG: UPF0175 family protein [Acidobacteriota bacterium]